MTIRLARGLISHINRRRDGFALQVSGAADPALVGRALQLARRDILRLGPGPDPELGLGPEDFAGPKYVSEVMPSSGGPIIVIDASHTPDRLVRQIPAILQRHLEDAGVTDASIGPPVLDERLVHPGGPAVMLHAFLPPPHPSAARPLLPPTWLAAATAWLDQVPVGEAWMETACPFPISRENVRPLVEKFSRGSNPAVFVGHLWQQARSLAVRGGEGLLTLGVGGSSYEADADLGLAGEELKIIARQLDPHPAYACLQVRPTFEIMLRLLERRFEDGEDGAPSDLVAASIDEFVPDAFPWQLMGPGHLARLGPSAQAASLRPDGFAELDLAPISTALASPDALLDLRARGKAILRPCLLSREEAIAERHRRWTAPHP